MSGVTLKEFEQYSSELKSIAVTVTTQLGEALANNRALSKEQFAEKLAQDRLAAIRGMQSISQDWADLASSAGSYRKADLFQRISDAYADTADKRMSMSAAEFNALSDARMLKAFGGATGLAGDIYSANQAFEQYSNGDVSGASATLMGMLGGMAGWALGYAVGGALLGGPVIWGVFLSVVVSNFVEDAFPGWDNIFGYMDGVLEDVPRYFTGSRELIRRDPLALDLDGDGIEAVGTGGSSTIQFDHNGDGHKTGTGWTSPDDGLLVMDRDGNGLIETGAELFGIDTVRADGSLAADGFEALRGLDSNGDGVFDGNDAKFSRVQVWQDVNQNGISESGELRGLDAMGIVSIDLNPTETDRNVGGGNVKSAESFFTYEGGTTSTIANLELQDNPFYWTFEDPIPLTASARTLPEMKGSGQVRDLREASSVSADLAALVADYAAESTRAGQLSRLDELVDAWADSSSMGSSVDLAASFGKELVYIVDGMDPEYFENKTWVDPVIQAEVDAAAAEAAELARIISTLERFNGRHFVDVEPDKVVLSNGGEIQFQLSSSSGSDGGGATVDPGPERAIVELPDWRIALLRRSYEVLRESVYGGLVVQTRLAGYTQALSLYMSDSRLEIDFSAMDSLLQAAYQADPLNAVADMVDLNRYAGRALYESGWDGLGTLRAWVAQSSGDARIADVHADMHVQVGSGDLGGTYLIDTLMGEAGADTLMGREGNDQLSGGTGDDDLYGQEGSDWISGDAGSDYVIGNEGDDILYGGAGDDIVKGKNGNDRLYGGAGDDLLNGGYGDDTYFYETGDGRDTIRSQDRSSYKNDVVVMSPGILPDDVSISRLGKDLILDLQGGTDSLTIDNYFHNDANDKGGYYRVEEIRFADGTVWGVRDIKQWLLVGNDTDEKLYGYATDDYMRGLGGADRMYAYAGDDVMLGGDGDDELYGNEGADIILGGAGEDWLMGNEGRDQLYGGAGDDVVKGKEDDDILFGGTGDDLLNGGSGNDVYRLLGGMGHDTIRSKDKQFGKYDVVELGGGLLPSDVTITRKGKNLNLALGGDINTLTIDNYFHNDANDAGGYYRVEEIRFDNGTVWSVADVKEAAIQGTNGDDRLYGYATDDSLDGLDGGDRIYGRAGNDTLHGGAGDDQVYGQDGDDWVSGGAGDDKVVGHDGNDTLYGNSGHDTLKGKDGDDWLEGGDGDDVLKAGKGTDRLYGGGGRDLLKGGRSANAGDFAGGIDFLYGQDGADTLTADEKPVLMYGGVGNDLLTGGSGVFNYLMGNEGDDRLIAGSAQSSMYGGAGNDVLLSGAGNDYLNGGQGSDTYQFDRGDGSDSLYEYNQQDQLAGSNPVDRLEFGNDVSHDQLWFARDDQDLAITVIGSQDQVRVMNWYAGEAYHVDEIQSGDGFSLLDSQVEQLVQAMAGFAPPAAGELALSPQLQNQLEPTLAAAWS